MSETDSFIDEVTEEVRRDRLFVLMKRYGWIAILLVFVLVGGAAWNEWSKAKTRAVAQDFGDNILAALELDERGDRAKALAALDSEDPSAKAVLDLLAAGEFSADDPQAAAARLLALADRDGTAPVYRQIAILKAVAIPGSGLSAQDRRARLDGIALVGGLTGLLADEQLAYLDIETGDKDAALERLQGIIENAETPAGLRQRVTQVIVALGGALPGG
ncbi:FIG00449901: hypothetical protein [hydrothermal vent metagenome]|uniref:Tetratricopeptide repeat-like domain-containing protein n=1 Tax=hydrothermal vent metagenome TaxID=652676 RepID=A0A3B0SAH4_9ZZZZ